MDAAPSFLIRKRAERGVTLAAWSRWMTRPNDPADETIRDELVAITYGNRAGIVFAFVCMSLVLSCYGLFQDVGVAGLLFAMLVPAAVARYVTIGRARRAASPVPLLAAGLGWAATIGLICGESARAGELVLTVLSGLVAAAIGFGGAYNNAGTPRFAMIQTLLFTAPYVVVAGLSGAPGMLVILLQYPLWMLGMFVLIRNMHATHSKLIRAQRLTHHLAFHDSLTGLPNRAHFMERLALECERAPQGSDERSYVLYLDLDGFKTVNDTLGHGAGDDLLRAVTHRFQAIMRPGDMFGRLGGDEFAVILPAVTASQAEAIGTRLISAARQPFLLEGRPPIFIGVSIGGVALAPPPDVHRTLQAADTMLYAAKRAGKGTMRLANAA